MKNEKLESAFQSHVIKRIKSELGDNVIILKNDPTYLLGFPDLTILGNKRYAVLECKRAENSHKQALQAYYVDKINNMSYARFINPSNEDEIIEDIIRIVR